jgi:hypothetical protein
MTTGDENFVERLRASKERVEARDFAAGKACGGTWAKQTAEYDDLERIAEFYQSEDDPEDLLSALRSLIDPQREMDRNDWSAFWEKWGTGTTSAAFARGFIEGAVAVYDEVENAPPETTR